MKHRQPWQNLIVFGAEGENNGSSDGSSDPPPSSDSSANESGNESGSGEDDSGNSGDDSSGDDDGDDREELKKALRSERRLRKAAEKERNQLKAASENNEEQKEIDKARENETAAQNKVTRLAERLLTTELNAAIRKAARDAKFIDEDDAVNGIARDDLDFDQDEDDPSAIDIDEKSIVDAVKALARKKPHFVRQPGDGKKTGSSFKGGQGTPDDQQAREAKFKEDYPSLR